MAPIFIVKLLRSRGLFYVGMAMLTFIYWASGFTKLFGFTQAQAEMAQFGLRPPAAYAALVIIVQLGGSALVIFGRRLAWLGAGMLVVFTLLTIPIAHQFWKLDGLASFLDMMLVFEHFTVIGGLILAAVLAEMKFGPHAQS
ncbi:DoxX family protein [Candidimonas humi]|uniref:DoxX family protein n=1 Tax=Candidimonas humi TaxID=683355 RepID=A0ABV8P1M7_9BURK|nr:DoxX family protein [Candidimonas humi]MBV6307214.1 DoxX family protein [Candidimonas humi]